MEVFSLELQEKLDSTLGAEKTHRLKQATERLVSGDASPDPSADQPGPGSVRQVETQKPQTVMTIWEDTGEVLDFELLDASAGDEQALEAALRTLEKPLALPGIESESIVGTAEVVMAEVLRDFPASTRISQLKVRSSDCLKGDCADFTLLVMGGRDGRITEVVNGKMWPWTSERVGYVFPPEKDGQRQPPEVFRLHVPREREAFEQSLLAAGLTLEDAPK